MKILIVEDEPCARENLRKILEEIDASVEIVGHTESVGQTVTWWKSNPAPDLIFMDIHLSDGSAFNTFTAVNIETPVIFTTAYDEYAIAAFKVNSIDYLLKPLEYKAVERALAKYRKLAATGYSPAAPSPAGKKKYSEKILIPRNNKLIPVDVGDVAYFYSSNGNTRVALHNNETFYYMKALDAIYAALNPSRFFRANKQFIIAKKSIKDVTICFDNRLLVALNAETPERLYVSKNRASAFKEWLRGD
jgi:DNA-binding LytR/AlgR family response regulator